MKLNITTAAELTAEALAQSKQTARQAMLAALSQVAEAITGPVPQVIRDSWPSKAAAARAHRDGTATADQVLMLEQESALTGETLDELAGKIIPNADVYEPVIGRMSGLHRTTAAAIEAATVPAEVTAALSVLQAELIGMAAQ